MAIIQRFGGALNLNVHVHALVVDGVFAKAGGVLRFYPGRRLTRDDVADVVAVVARRKEYQRGQTRPYTQQTPLNRLVDAAQPESDAAREFGAAVERLLSDPSRQAGREALRARLASWQGLHSRLLPVLEGSELLREAVPLSAELHGQVGAGLEALSFLEQGTPAPASWWEDRARLLEKPSNAPHALEAAIRPGVKKLLVAAKR